MISLSPWLLQGWTAPPPAIMPGQIPDASMTVGSLPGLGPLTGLHSSALTAKELKYTDIHNIGAMTTPLHFLEVKLAKMPQPVKSELDEEAERRKRRWVKNKVVAAPCQNKKKEWKEFLQQESEWLEHMNVELRTQMEELKQEWQQLILMLNWHRPTCIIRTDSIKTPDSEGHPLLQQLEK
ncbi:jun dimerization protein 2-like [Eptesicus fuscus]|uniref:jun dimerization protein 2-like n=1 Tax=Eptesicus fuscus TaxID=29078 RepID=UPI002403FAFD|nr:jun dimerization protein 2-like [Eptesicus fuscus]